jgi:hypothetical protein
MDRTTVPDEEQSECGHGTLALLYPTNFCFISAKRAIVLVFSGNHDQSV